MRLEAMEPAIIHSPCQGREALANKSPSKRQILDAWTLTQLIRSG
jgi:hypothetical protein